jgi:hypothetical protein
MAWRDIPTDYKDIAEAALLPDPTFADDQRYWFQRWWLACTQADVDAINALLPSSVQVSSLEWNGGLYLGSDLLTDSLLPEQMYFAAQSVIQGLICTYFDPPPVSPAP